MTSEKTTDCLWLTLSLLVGLEWPTAKRRSEDDDWIHSTHSKKSASISTRSRSKTSTTRSQKTASTEELEKEVVVILPKIDCRYITIIFLTCLECLYYYYYCYWRKIPSEKQYSAGKSARNTLKFSKNCI